MLNQWEAFGCCYLASLAGKTLDWSVKTVTDRWLIQSVQGCCCFVFFKHDFCIFSWSTGTPCTSWQFTCCKHVATINQLFALVAEGGDKTGGCGIEHRVQMKKHCFLPFTVHLSHRLTIDLHYKRGKVSRRTRFLSLCLSVCLVCVCVDVRVSVCVRAYVHAFPLKCILRSDAALGSFSLSLWH